MKFTFLKIPVTIHMSFWIFLFFFVGMENSPPLLIINAIIWTFSLLVHEYGHALTAQYFGKKPSINLVAFGGFASYEDYNVSDKQKFLITLMGPLAESVLIGISYYLLKANLFHNYYVNYTLYITMKLNIFWVLINLLPIFPMDGSKILAHILKVFIKDRAIKATLHLGNIIALIGAMYYFSQKDYYLSGFFVILGIENFKMFSKTPQSGPFKKSNYTLLNESKKALEKKDSKHAKAILLKLLRSKENSIKITATEDLANLLYQENQKKKAYDLLLKSDITKLKQGKCLLCKLAFDEKNFSLIEKYSRDIYEIDPSLEIALLNSKAFAKLKKPKLSAGWLKTASMFESEKKISLKKILEDKIFEGVKKDKSFSDLLKK